MPVRLGVREPRLEENLTQRRLSERADVTITTVCAAERGHEVTLTTAVKLADALGRTIDSMLVRL